MRWEGTDANDEKQERTGRCGGVEKMEADLRDLSDGLHGQISPRCDESRIEYTCIFPEAQ